MELEQRNKMLAQGVSDWYVSAQVISLSVVAKLCLPLCSSVFGTERPGWAIHYGTRHVKLAALLKTPTTVVVESFERKAVYAHSPAGLQFVLGFSDMWHSHSQPDDI